MPPLEDEDAMKEAAARPLLAAVSGSPPDDEPEESVGESPLVAADVEKRLARFAPTELRVDLSGPRDADRRVLGDVPVDVRPIHPWADELTPAG